MPPKILITGFEPFGDYPVNSSWEAVKHTAAQLGDRARALLLPVDHLGAHHALRAVLEELTPEVVLCTGLAAGNALRIELCARKAVELGAVDGPRSCIGAWPWAELEAALSSSPLGVARSEDAGRYVCESTYWSLLAFRAIHGYPQFAAFVHVPPLSESVTAELLSQPLEAALRARLGASAAG